MGAAKESGEVIGADLRDEDLRGADLIGADLRDANLTRADLRDADLRGADLRGADLIGADLRDANLTRADLRDADLRGANLIDADLTDADLTDANLRGANLTRADLRDANLTRADLIDADLTCANLIDADLTGADLRGAKNMIKRMGVETGNFYWKRFENKLNNNGFQFHVGVNTLKEKEVFESDERKLCSFPGFHFASRSWCAVNYPDRPLEAKIRISEDAKINEPWATDGKASADKIEIIQVFDVATGEDVTDQFLR